MKKWMFLAAALAALAAPREARSQYNSTSSNGTIYTVTGGGVYNGDPALTVGGESRICHGPCTWRWVAYGASGYWSFQNSGCSWWTSDQTTSYGSETWVHVSNNTADYCQCATPNYTPDASNSSFQFTRPCDINPPPPPSNPNCSGSCTWTIAVTTVSGPDFYGNYVYAYAWAKQTSTCATIAPSTADCGNCPHPNIDPEVAQGTVGGQFSPATTNCDAYPPSTKTVCPG